MSIEDPGCKPQTDQSDEPRRDVPLSHREVALLCNALARFAGRSLLGPLPQPPKQLIRDAGTLLDRLAKVFEASR